MKLIKRYLFVPFLFVFIVSCTKENVVLTPPTYHYFPTEVGKYVIYDVDSVYHADNDFNTDDSIYRSHFQLKEVIVGMFLDGEKRRNQLVMRYKRSNDTLDWNIVNVVTQILSDKGAYRTEDNIAFHKLAYPINDQTNWNGNDANTMAEEIFRYGDIHVPYSVGTNTFDSTITVIQVDESNFIEKIYGAEVYASQVGLVYKERDELRKLNGMVVKGIEYTMRVKSFGKE